MKKSGLFFLFFLGMIATVSAQKQINQTVRLTGIVMDADERSPLPYVSVRISGTVYGTATDSNGYFSIFMNPGDTLVFTSIGYHEAHFIMPYEMRDHAYSLVQLMRQAAVMLNEVVVFPWPTLEQFEQAFLEVKPKRNMTDLVEEMQRNMLKDNQKYNLTEYEADQMRYQRLYRVSGEIPPNNFLNPVRWSNFIRDIRKGKVTNTDRNDRKEKKK